MFPHVLSLLLLELSIQPYAQILRSLRAHTGSLMSLRNLQLLAEYGVSTLQGRFRVRQGALAAKCSRSCQNHTVMYDTNQIGCLCMTEERISPVKQ